MTAWGATARLAAAVYLAIVLAGGAVVARAHRHDDAITVSVLGAGSRLSVLVTAGEARLLIAGGDDASAFANALAGARPLFSNRVDLLVLVGDRGDLPAISRAVNDIPYRRVFVVDGPLRNHLADLGLGPDRLVRRPLTIRLPRSVVVTLEPGAAGADAAPAWTATIEHAGTRVAVVGGNGRVPDRAAAVVFGGRHDPDNLAGVRAPVLVVPAAAGKELGTDPATSANPPDWIIRVAAGDAVPLRFVDGGLRLPDNARPFVPPASPEASRSERPQS